MGRVAFVLGGEGGFFTQDYKVGATTVSGVLAARETTLGNPGEVKDVVGTGSAGASDFVNVLGLYAEAITYTAAPTSGADQSIPTVSGIEGVVRIVTHPFAMLEFNVAGGATAGTALATVAPANIVKNTVADAAKLTITAAEVGTVSMVGGLIKGRTGANKGQTRKITAHTNNASTAVTVAFLNTIGVNDTFIRVPFSKMVKSLQLTSNKADVNGIIATSDTLGPATIYRVKIGVDDISSGGDPGKDVVLVYCLMRDHMLKPLAA